MRSTRYSFFTFALLASQWIAPTTAVNTTTCYWPSGAIADDFTPCDPSVANSPCCRNEDKNVCLEGNLCMSVYGHPVRGACTDRTWKSSACPSVCSEASKNTYSNLISCTSFNQWCCYDETIAPKDTECCSRNFSVGFIMSITLAGGFGQLSPATGIPTAPSNFTTLTQPLDVEPDKTGIIVASVLGGLLGLSLIGALGLFWRERGLRKLMQSDVGKSYRNLEPIPTPTKYMPQDRQQISDTRELLADQHFPPMELHGMSR